MASNWTTLALCWQSQQLGQKGCDSATSVNICLVCMIRSRASGPRLLADYESEVEESCSLRWRTVLSEVCNTGAEPEAAWVRVSNAAMAFEDRHLVGSPRPSTGTSRGERVGVVCLAPCACRLLRPCTVTSIGT